MRDLPIGNKWFSIRINSATGALTRISNPADRYRMNWICSTAETPWLPIGHEWGLGYANIRQEGIPLARWQKASAMRVSSVHATVRYRLGDIELRVERRLKGDRFSETYEFTNRGRCDVPARDIGIYVPFNDNYPDSQECLVRRCNAHVWCGGNVAYVNCIRMGGAAPHLGLVLTRGRIDGYGIEGRGLMRGSSNVRGTIVLNQRGDVLRPGGRLVCGWTLFWHEGHDDFFRKAGTVAAFARLQASEYTVVKGRSVVVKISAHGRKRLAAAVDGRKLTLKDAGGSMRGKVRLGRRRGEHIVGVHDSKGWATFMRIMVVDPLEKLLTARAHFIVKNQQVRMPGSPFHGAFLPYDNCTKSVLRDPDWADRNEGRERVGMGVFLALFQQRWPDRTVASALKLYHRFVRNKLQEKDGAVLNGVGGTPHRLYNYTWVARFHLEMYHAFGKETYLRDFLDTMRSYYRNGGDAFYAIDVPALDGVLSLENAGMRKQAVEYLELVLGHAAKIRDTGLNYPPHEVRYEQSIVGPAVHLLLDAAVLTRGESFRRAAEAQIRCLEAFGGRQPDYHLHEIAIRHWDDFWFGHSAKWGDTMPHYWSALTGFVFYRYWQVTGEETYRSRARMILMNNLCLFAPDGSASCAYVYPDSVDGDRGAFYDRLANDQDYALVFLMAAARLDPDFSEECWK